MCIYIYKSLTFNRLEVLHHLLRNNFSNDWCGMHRLCKTTSAKTQVRLHGSRGGVFVGHRPPRDPGGLLLKVNVKNVVQNQKKTKHRKRLEDLHLFRCSTHTPRCREAFFNGSPPPLLEAKKRKKFFISSDVRHTRPDAARLFSRCLFIYIYTYIYIYTRPGPNKPT